MSSVTTGADGSCLVDPATFTEFASEFDVMVLDVHGVVLNKPLHDFVLDVGERSGEGGPELLRRWRNDLRVPFWEGYLSEAEMWMRLAPGFDPHVLRDDFESRFAAGPLFGAVVGSSGPMWLLSNHRTDWLLPRLERFGLSDRFERVLVSDRIRAAKPSPRAFDEIVERSSSASVCFVDDQSSNVEGARARGVSARLLGPGDVGRRSGPSPPQPSGDVPDTTGPLVRRL